MIDSTTTMPRRRGFKYFPGMVTAIPKGFEKLRLVDIETLKEGIAAAKKYAEGK